MGQWESSAGNQSDWDATCPDRARPQVLASGSDTTQQVSESVLGSSWPEARGRVGLLGSLAITMASEVLLVLEE